MHDAAMQGHAKEKVPEIIAFLSSYAVEHFNWEENYFTEKGFPEKVKHCSMHKAFIDKVTEVNDRLAKEGPSSMLAIEVSKFVGDWLVMHIKKADKRYCNFVKTGSCDA